jgi:hypothetical protein
VRSEPDRTLRRFRCRSTPDSPRESQRKFVKLALDLGHRLEQFTIIKVPTAM